MVDSPNHEPEPDDLPASIGEILPDLDSVIGSNQPFETPEARTQRDIDDTRAALEGEKQEILDRVEHLDDPPSDQRRLSEIEIELRHLRNPRLPIHRPDETP